ncbi:MAG: hypothetical protein WCR06_05570 [bacterium]
MSSALKKLAYAAGTLLALIVLSLALMNGMPLSDALFRAAVVMFAGTVILALFFRFFTQVLFAFMHEKMAEQLARHNKERSDESTARRNVASQITK